MWIATERRQPSPKQKYKDRSHTKTSSRSNSRPSNDIDVSWSKKFVYWCSSDVGSKWNQKRLQLFRAAFHGVNLGNHWHGQHRISNCKTVRKIGLKSTAWIKLQLIFSAHFGFNCKILYHNRNEKEYAKDVNATYYKELNQMLPECDFVCVICNLTDETRHIISKEQFDLMKPTAVFCNVSRGGTVDQEALLDCLM